MNRRRRVSTVAGILLVAGAMLESPSWASAPTLDVMPAGLETQYALSALPPALREHASVYRLDPAKGYTLAKQGTNGLTCLVERTQWEVKELRDDVYIPLCYDAVGTKAHLKVIMDAAALRARGLDAAAIHAEVLARYKGKTYAAPEKSGVSYMVAPIMRAPGPPDMQVHTMAMPHTMVYAPNVTNEDIGAAPDLARPASLLSPFIDRQGIAEQSYVIQMVGAAERSGILATEKDLVAALCAYRAVLCLEHQ
jgi:hypothetical protein